jgi:hypothetical protein
MVLVRRIGQPRSFWLVLVFYVGTFGVYGIYWHYKTHHEVYRQFELDLDARDEGTVWLVLDRVFFPLRWIFQYGFVSNVTHVRRRLHADQGITPSQFLGLVIPGATLSYGAFILLVIGQSFLDTPNEGLAYLFSQLAVATYVLGAALQVPAYYRLQRDMNRIWHRFDERMDALMPPAPSRPGVWQPVLPAPAVSPPAPPAWPPSESPK